MGDTIKSRAVGEALGNRELQPLASPGYCRLSSIVAAKGERIDWICSSVGLVRGDIGEIGGRYRLDLLLRWSG